MPVGEIDVHSPSARQSGAIPRDGVPAAPILSNGWAARLKEHGRLTLETLYTADDGGDFQFTSISEVSPVSPAGGVEGL